MQKAARLPPVLRLALTRVLAELANSAYRLERPLPPHRQWAERLEVSTMTVFRVFAILQKEGLVESREGSSTFLRRRPDPGLVRKYALPAPAAAQTTITIWTRDQMDPHKARLALVRQRFLAEFSARYPFIALREQPLPAAANAGTHALLMRSIIAGPEPTMHSVAQTWLPFLSAEKLAAPLRVCAPAARKLDEYLALLKPRCRQACSQNGKLYLLPNGMTCSFLLYHRASLRQAGLDAGRPAADWDELEHYLRRLAQPGRPALGLEGPGMLLWLLTHLVYQCAEKNNTAVRLPPVDWQSAAAQRALKQFLQWVIARGWIGYRDANTSFSARVLAGEIPVALDDGGLAVQIIRQGQAGNFLLAPWPAGPGGRVISLLNCTGWFINGHAAPEQQQAAARYILEREQWVHTGAGAAFLRKTGVIPGLLSPMADPRADRFACADLPAQWREVLESLDARGQWEAEEADWQKPGLAQSLARALQAGKTLNPGVLAHELGLNTAAGELNLAG